MNAEEQKDIDYQNDFMKFLSKRLKSTQDSVVPMAKSFKAVRSMFLKLNRDFDIIWKTKLIGLLYTGYIRIPYLQIELNEYRDAGLFGPDNNPDAYRSYKLCLTTIRKTQIKFRKRVIAYYAALGDRMPFDIKREIMTFVVKLN